jgi:hypothetical protein
VIVVCCCFKAEHHEAKHKHLSGGEATEIVETFVGFPFRFAISHHSNGPCKALPAAAEFCFVFPASLTKQSSNDGA